MSSITPQAVPIHPLPPVRPPAPPEPTGDRSGLHFTYSVNVSGPAPTSATFNELGPAIEYARSGLENARRHARQTGDHTPATATISGNIIPGQPERLPPVASAATGPSGVRVPPPSPPPLVYTQPAQ